MPQNILALKYYLIPRLFHLLSCDFLILIIPGVYFNVFIDQISAKISSSRSINTILMLSRLSYSMCPKVKENDNLQQEFNCYQIMTSSLQSLIFFYKKVDGFQENAFTSPTSQTSLPEHTLASRSIYAVRTATVLLQSFH